MQSAYIVAAARTPIGKFGGGLKDVSPVELGAHVMKAVLERANLQGSDLDFYIMGNVLRAGHGQLLPRQAAVKAGIPVNVDGYGLDMVCSSGMMATINGAMMIRCDDANLVLTGGMESMSQGGFVLSHRARWGYKYLAGKPEPLRDVLEVDGLSDPLENHASMGDETDRLSAEYTLTRAELDKVAYMSHMRAAAASEDGTFASEIAPIKVQTRRGTVVVEKDEGIRPNTSLEKLAQLRPAFTKDGVLTAGNASSINDGAAAMILASGAAVEKHNLKPLGRIVGSSWSAVDSWRFAEAPIPAVKKLLAKHNLTVEDIDLWENNEAFATNSVLFNKELGIPYEKLNVYGGGISLGHPIGATGARLIVTLLTALHNRDGKYGIASLCHGTGGGTAVLVERA